MNSHRQRLGPRRASARRSAADGSPTAAALTAACAERNTEPRMEPRRRAPSESPDPRIERGKHVKRRIDPARISALTRTICLMRRPKPVHLTVGGILKVVFSRFGAVKSGKRCLLHTFFSPFDYD